MMEGRKFTCFLTMLFSTLYARSTKQISKAEKGGNIKRFTFFSAKIRLKIVLHVFYLHGT